jgi:hypothetical protein
MKKLFFLAVAVFIALLLACNVPLNSGGNSEGEGEVRFGLSSAENADATLGRSLSGRAASDTVGSVIVTIKDTETAEIIYDKKALALYKFNETYVSDLLSLNIGHYQITEFLVVNEANEVIYATPVEGSPMAGLVNDPLPIDFSVQKDNLTTVVPQVVRLGAGDTPADFGYVEFGFDIVEDTNMVTFNFAARVRYINDPENVFGGSIMPGTILIGHYTYDLSTIDTNESPTVADYWHRGANTHGAGIEVTGGGFTFKTDPNNTEFLVEILNDHVFNYVTGPQTEDVYLLRSYKNLPLNGEHTVSHISWQLNDKTATALSSIGLPIVPPVLENWDQSYGFDITGDDESDPGTGMIKEPYLIRADIISIK